MHRHHFWYARRRGGCENFEPALAWAGHGHRRFGGREADDGPRSADLSFSVGGGDDEIGGAGLGVRRPLRFLAWKLDLTAEQLEGAARILERLKIERAQAAVDQRRSAADLADAVESEAFNGAQADAATEKRVTAALAVQRAVAKSLAELHGILEPDQRRKLAMLIRTRAITF
jgi:Spy/CpxP family protein refolding chaperone